MKISKKVPVLPMSHLAPEKIRALGEECFVRVGVPEQSARMVVDCLVTTSLRGIDSHGVRLIPHYVRAIMLGRVNPKPDITFTRTFPSTGIVNAGNGLGIVAGMAAMDRVVKMAKKTGMAAVAVSRSSHFGAAGLYTIKAAREGMIGFACTHVEALVLPYNGRKPFLGTNAVSIAVPCAGEEPICLDMATTNMSLNKLNMYKAAGMRIPEGWAADARGKATTDPKKAQLLTHFGSYKGYGFAFMIDMFSSMLTGMPWGPHITPMFPLNGKKRNLGHFFWAINIEGFELLATFKRRMRKMANELRRVPSVRGEPVMVPGDPEKRSFARRTQAHKIPIPAADYQALVTIAQKLGMPYKRYIR